MHTITETSTQQTHHYHDPNRIGMRIVPHVIATDLRAAILNYTNNSILRCQLDPMREMISDQPQLLPLLE